MGRYRWIDGMQLVRQEAGFNKAGQLVQVSELIRPFASTVGVRYVSVKVDGVGMQTEQFSGQRCELEPLVFEQLYQTYVNDGAPQLTPAQKAAQTRKLRKQGLAPAAPVKPLALDDLATRRRNAALKAAETRRNRAAL